MWVSIVKTLPFDDYRYATGKTCGELGRINTN
jgi:hypothetical protein